MAEWTTAYVNDLPDSAFACPEQRKYPHHDVSGKLDLPHLRAALSRVGDPSNEQCGKAHLEMHAKAEGMGERASKALLPVKAAPLDDEQWQGWLDGKLPLRLLAIPFGGPLPKKGAPLGADIDGEFFDDSTDIYGPYPILRKERERLVDWHHRIDPTGRMKGTIIGKAILDSEPDEDGWWEEVWAKAGEARLALIDRLRKRGTQLFGSTEAIYKDVDESGRIKVWPYVRQTLSTSPQNTLSILRPMKASLQDADEAQIELASPLKAWLADLDALSANLPQTFPDGSDAAATAMRLNERMPDVLDAWGVHKP